MKKLLATALAVVMAIGLAACGSSGSGTQGGGATTAAQGGGSEAGTTNGRYDVVKVAIAKDPENLKPVNGNGQPKTMFYHEIYEALFDYDDDGNFVPSIGKEINIIDSLHYQVVINDCVYDSAGNHITADDVVYSFNWLVGAGEAVKFEVFDSIKAVDDYTVELTWAFEPTSWDELEFPFTRTWIFSEKAFGESDFAIAPIATGPYTVKEYTVGSKVVLEANDDYWALKVPEIMDTHLDIHRANVQTIELIVIAEAAQAQIALEQGTVDFADYISTMAMDEFTEGGALSDKYTAVSQEQGDYRVAYVNAFEGKPCSDVNLRKAIWYGIDSKAICKAMGGNFSPMNTIGNSAYPDWDERWNEGETYMNTYDPDKAKDFLAKSNYKGEDLTLMVGGAEADQNAATMMQAQLETIGIKTHIYSLTDTIMNVESKDPNKWDIQISGIGGPSLVGSYNRLMGGKGVEWEGQNYTIFFVNDPKLQELYDTAKADATHDYEHIDAAIQYATTENAWLYALAEEASAVVCSRKITKLYQREGSYATFGPSEYEGCTAEHSANAKALELTLPEPSALPNNVHIFYQVFNPADGAGIVWKLTVNPDDSWTLDIKSTKPDIQPSETVTLTGDKNFPNDGVENSIITTPPQEGDKYWKENADFYEEDGVCKWIILDNNGLVPVNFKSPDYPNADAYIKAWNSGELQPIG